MVAATALGLYESVEKAFEEIGKSNDIKVYLPKEEIVLQYEHHRAQMNRLYKKIWGGEWKDGSYQFRA